MSVRSSVARGGDQSQWESVCSAHREDDARLSALCTACGPASHGMGTEAEDSARHLQRNGLHPLS